MTKTLSKTIEYVTLLEETVKGLKYQHNRDIFIFDRRQYKVTSIVEIDDELEINFEAVAKTVAKKFTSVSFIKNKPVYDGFNDKAFEKKAPIKRLPKTKEEVEAHKKQYQAEYYLRKTKKKREEERAKNPKKPRSFTLTCAICGKEFVSASNRSKYCSSECCKIGKYETNKAYLQTYKETDGYKEAIRKTNAKRRAKYHEMKEQEKNNKNT